MVIRKRTPQTRTEVVCQPASEPPSGDTSAGSPSARPGPPVGSGSPAAFSAVSSVAWQALLFVDGRAAGRLTQPLVTIDSEGGAAQVSLHFQTLAPARGGEEQPLQLPADELSSRSLRVQVFGRQGDSTFAAPQSFQAEGRELVAALAVQRQWQEYQRRHQAARQSAGQPTSAANFAHSSTLAVQSGDGLERLQAIFDVASRPAWLKGIVCRFLVSEASQPNAAEPVDGGCGSRKGGAGEQGAAAVARSGMAAQPEGPQDRPEGQPGSWAAGAAQKQPAPAPVAAGAAPQQSVASAAVAQQQAWLGGKGRKGRGHHGRQQREARLSRGTSPAPSQEELLLPPPGLSPRAGSRASSCSFASCSSITPPLSPRAAVTTGSKLGPAGKQHQAQEKTGMPAAVATPAAAAPQAMAVGVAAAAGMAGTPSRRNRSRSRSRHGHRAGQDAGGVRRMPKLFPAANAGRSDEQAEAEAGKAAADVPAVRGGSTASSAVPIAAPGTGRGRGRAGQRADRRGGRSKSGTPRSGSSPAPAGLLRASRSSSATPTGVSPAAVGLAVAAADEQPLPLAEQAILQQLQAAGATAAQLERLQEASRLAADLLGDSEPQGPVPQCMPLEAAPQQPALQRRPAGPQQQQAAQAQPRRPPAVQPGPPAMEGPLVPQPPLQPAAAQPQQPAAVLPPQVPSQLRQPAQAQRQPAPPARPQAPVPQGAAAAVQLQQQTSAAPKPASPVPASRHASLAVPVEPLAGQAVALVRPAPSVDDASQQVIAAVWQGAADAADLAAALAASPEHSHVRRRGGSSGSPPPSPLCVERSGGSSSSMRSECSGGLSASSSLSLSPDCCFQRLAGNPSEFGLSYQFGYGRPAPPHHIAGAAASGQHAMPPAAMQAHDGAAGFVPRLGSFGSGSGLAGGSGFGGGGPSGSGSSLPLPPGRSGSFHRRSASTSSSGRNGYVASPGPAGSEAAAYQAAAAVAPQWHGGQPSSCSSLNWCAEPYMVPCQPPYPAAQQPYMPVQLGMQPGQFVPRSQSVGARPQHWGRQLPPEAACDALAWQPQLPQHMRRNSGSWPMEGLAPYQAVPMSASAPAPYMQHSGNGGSGGRSGSSRFANSSASGGGGYGPSSAPPSAMQSPVMDRRRQQGPPASAPPPPPLLLPVLDLQMPESAVDAPDLERFLQAATPQVVPPPTGLQDLTLADVWRWYEGPSTVGCEVATMGGPRGPATSYYLPYLSAVQLFVPASSDDEVAVAGAACAGARGPAAQLLSYPNGLDSWPERMRPVVQWGEGANMKDRVPLHSRLAELAGPASGAHPLTATRVADLHPFSWFAVAWYPLYRVPEAPLTARFLTFHTLASLWEAASEAAEAHRRQQAELAAAAAAEAQRQRAQAEEQAEAGEEVQPRPQQAAAAASSRRGLPSRPSYKSMLEAGLSPPEAGLPPAQTATPTAVCSFPGSPTCSDAGTRTTLASSRPHSVDGASLGRSRLACSSSGAASSAGGGSERGCEAGSHAASSGPASASCTPASPAASEVADGAEPLPVPVAGLVWYATGRDENWQETLVAAHLPPGLCPAPGTPLADGARVVGSWRGMAVLARPYPVAKGGPLGWEIQQEEMAQCAERLACGAGLLALRPLPGSADWDAFAGLPAGELGVSCPDWEFFMSRMERWSA